MQHPDEGLIHAWLDGALSQTEGAEIERHVSECATCQPVVAEARGLIAGSSRIISQLDGGPGSVIPAATQKKRRPIQALPLSVLAAAALILAITLGKKPTSFSSRPRAVTTRSLDSMFALRDSSQRHAAVEAQKATSQLAERQPPDTRLPAPSVTRSASPTPVRPQPQAAPVPPPTREAVGEERSALRIEQPATQPRAASAMASGGAAAAVQSRVAIGSLAPVAATGDQEPRFCAIFSMDSVVDSVPSTFALVGTARRGFVARVTMPDQAGAPIAGLSFTADADTVLIARGAKVLMTASLSGNSFTATTTVGQRRGHRTFCR